MVLTMKTFYASAQPYFKEGEDPKLSHQQWVKVENMSDEFNGEFDESKWQKEPLGNGWYWIGRFPGLFESDNVTVADGNLNVTTEQFDEPKHVKGKDWTHGGGIVRSIHAGKVGYYYETRMQANKTVMSSTFWLMTKTQCPKKLELDIHECVGRTTSKSKEWSKEWDHIYHSNMIHRKSPCNSASVQIQGQKLLAEKNNSRYFVYAAWWKSPKEVRFYLDGVYTYSIVPSIEFDVESYLQMAIETYDWNPIPDDGGIFKEASWDDRTTKYDWIRTWELVDKE